MSDVFCSMSRFIRGILSDAHDILIGLTILAGVFLIIAAIYLVIGVVAGGLCVAFVYYWPFGGAYNKEAAIVMGIFVGVIVAMICWLEKFPI